MGAGSAALGPPPLDRRQVLIADRARGALEPGDGGRGPGALVGVGGDDDAVALGGPVVGVVPLVLDDAALDELVLGDGVLGLGRGGGCGVSRGDRSGGLEGLGQGGVVDDWSRCGRRGGVGDGSRRRRDLGGRGHGGGRSRGVDGRLALGGGEPGLEGGIGGGCVGHGRAPRCRRRPRAGRP